MASRDTPALDYRTCVRQVEQALVSRLALGLLERVPPVADKPALRALDAKWRQGGDLVFVESLGKVCVWTAALDEPDDDTRIFQSLPWVNSQGQPKRGRWVLADDMSYYATREMAQALPLCMLRTGYLRSVELYQGRPDTEALYNRFTGRRPSLAVRYTGHTTRLKNVAPSIYRIEMQFQLIGLSFHPRRGDEALEGSDLPEEAKRDPGLFQILGDADDLCQGQTDVQTGYYHLVPGVVKVLPSGHQIVQELLAQRLFVGAANITVVCNVHRPDRDTLRFTSIGLTSSLADAPRGQPLDPDSAVLDGLNVEWPQPTLLTAPKPGRVRVGGREFALAPSAFTFAASAETYRFVTPEGALRYESVPLESAAPETPAGWLLVGKTTTTSSGILMDEFLCTTLFDVDDRDVDTVEEGADLS